MKALAASLSIGMIVALCAYGRAQDSPGATIELAPTKPTVTPTPHNTSTSTATIRELWEELRRQHDARLAAERAKQASDALANQRDQQISELKQSNAVAIEQRDRRIAELESAKQICDELVNERDRKIAEVKRLNLVTVEERDSRIAALERAERAADDLAKVRDLQIVGLQRLNSDGVANVGTETIRETLSQIAKQDDAFSILSGIVDDDALRGRFDSLRAEYARLRSALPLDEWRAAAGVAAQGTGPLGADQGNLTLRQKDGTTGPEMVVISRPCGAMGVDFGQGPCLRRLAVGRYPVTFDEYDAFARSTGRGLPDDNGWGRGRRPVINVSFEDAKAYAAWLRERTGREVRLPTEAEWREATGAGSNSYPWGNEIDKDLANCRSCGSPWMVPVLPRSGPSGLMCLEFSTLLGMSGSGRVPTRRLQPPQTPPAQAMPDAK